uniref:Fatty acid hydroxylase domain-containing protein n=1 Tax=Solanum lycopersicum TaxID=4081 RepID=A0A3Q7EJF1_SOLLC
MASKPGILTEWPWTFLGNFKYLVLAPFVCHSTYTYFMSKDERQRDIVYIIILPLLFSRIIHNQIWISLSRYRTAKGNNRIVDKSIEDDQIIFNGLLYYIGYLMLEQAHHLPLWRSDGIIIIGLLHSGPVEFLYYWLHRALHHHFLYSRYHSHHHSSIATEPITSVIHPFAEHLSYFTLFSIPLFTTVFTRTASIASFGAYVTYIDFMNNMGHCNFELIPKWMFSVFPPLKYFMYTPSYHSLHHTQFRTNYSLFMPMYDYIYDTLDKSSDTLYEKSLEREAEVPDVVHLTHLTTPESIYHLRLGFASLASNPHTSRWYVWLMWPVTLWSIMITWIYGRTFVVERNIFKNIKLQTWAIPKYRVQYFMKWQRETINKLIEESIMEADNKGIKEETLNSNGELYLKRHPQLKVKVVDGSSLAVAVVLNSIPKGTSQVVLRGRLSKVAYSIALALCQRGIQVATLDEEDYKRLNAKLTHEAATNLVLSKSFVSKTWLVGDGLSEDEQLKAPKGTLFIPYSQFPPRKSRKDCFYFNTPAMIAPKHLENVDSCENWLPRRVMSAWRIAGILHALEGWNENECGDMMFDIEKAWKASVDHGFRPLTLYLVLAPFACHSIYTFFMSKDESERDMFNILLLPLTLFRMVHYQTWISLSRYRTAKGNNRILDKSIEFDQVDRESNWWEEQLNSNGELYLRRHPQLKVKVVDGSSLAVAVVLNSIPEGTSQVVLRGSLSKVANSIALALCQGEIQTWLVGDGLSDDEQLKVPKGTLFIPFSQFPVREVRKDCFYFNTPAMIAPKHLENVDSCENWLPRRVMSAWRIAGIVHALEGWNEHDCGDTMIDVEKGLRPPTPLSYPPSRVHAPKPTPTDIVTIGYINELY